MSPNQKLCTCVKCKRVSVAYTLAKAEAEIDSFNKWFETQPKETQDMFGGRPSSLKSYKCVRCGSDKFRAYELGDLPGYAVTMSPVVYEDS